MTEQELIERDELIEDVIDAIEDGDIEEAEDIADEIIELFPDEPAGYYYMGEALFIQTEYDEALENYQKAIELDAANIGYQTRLALMHAKLSQNDAARKLYKKILEQDANHIDAMISLGVLALNENDMEEALEYLNQAIGKDAENADAFKIRAIVHQAHNNFAEALDDLEVALLTYQEDTDLWMQKINLLDMVGKVKDAHTAFEEWVALDEEDNNRLSTYADYLMGKEEYAKAERQYTSSIEAEQFGDYAALYSFLNRGWARLWQEKFEEAESDFRKVISMDAKIGESYMGMAEAKLEQDDQEGAITFLDLGLNIVVDGAWALNDRKGQIYTQQENWEEATAAFQANIAMDDDESKAAGYFGLGNMHHANDDLDAAYEAWRNAENLYHMEATEKIRTYCQAQIEAALKEREGELVSDMQDDFDANKKSKILAPLFNKLWKVDVKTTASKNKMFAQMPKDMEKKIMGLLENICLGIVHKGMFVLNPGQAGVRMLYAIEDETTKAVTINGIPLNGTDERSFTISPAAKHITLRGFGEEGADIDLYMHDVGADKLQKPTQKALKEAAKEGHLDFMGDDFKKVIG